MNFDENMGDYCCGLEEMSANAAAFLKSYARTCTVFNKTVEAEGDGKAKIINEYLDFCYNKKDGEIQGPINVVDISLEKGGFESITTQNLPNIRNYSLNSLLLVEFFTHCCINCIHSIEDVREVHEEIENMFQDTVKKCSNNFRGLKALSIHSPKFPREKDTESIKAFCKRMKMDHSEVVNDPQCILWNELGVTCWPTLLILGPNVEGSGPNLLFTIMGEGHKEDLMMIIKNAMEYFSSVPISMVDEIDSSKIAGEDGNGNWKLAVVDAPVNTFFRFPGKVNVFEDQIIVSDSGNNRIIVLRTPGHVEKIIGGQGKGYKDGDLAHALFYNPQGIAIESKFVFYVADTGNHSIRKVDLQNNQVSTLIKPNSKIILGEEEVTMKSPWDLIFYDPETLIIAAAGSHRLFGYFFKGTNLFGAMREAGTLAVIAGSGREENRNNSYILKASFAQPSGLTVVSNNASEKTIYIADSESSSIRAVTPKGQVVGVVGGSRDPTDLFAFGDVDGKAINVKLQHPMGVCAGSNSGEIFIADTYNHKIKRINLESKECVTYISNLLDEPSGICRDPLQNCLYVADTNNHSIKVINLETNQIREIDVISDKLNKANGNGVPNGPKVDKEFSILTTSKTLQVNVVFSPLPDAYEGGQWKVVCDTGNIVVPQKGTVEKKSDANENEGIFSFEITNDGSKKASEFYIVADIFYCKSDSCLKRTRRIKVICSNDVISDGSDDAVTLSWKNMLWEK